MAPPMSAPIFSARDSSAPADRKTRPAPRHSGGRPGVLLLMLLLLVVPQAAWPQEVTCSTSGIKVSGGSARSRQWVCIAVREGGAFLRLNGLKPAPGTTVLLTEKLQEGESLALGEYHVAGNRILLLTYEAALRRSRQNPSPFGMPMSPELWQSYVVHELAHAAAEGAFAPGVEKFAASEYIAAVAQLSSLPESVRTRLLRHFPNLPGFGSTTEITALYYFFAPGKFAVKAYQHYSRPGNGPPFIQRLLREGLPDSR